MAQLLVDVTPFKSVLRESKERPGVYEVEGVMQRAVAENQNGRVYSKAILEREASKYTKEFVERGNAFGELDHPESSVVNLQNVSHNVKEMHWEGDNLLGTVEVLGTPSGNILKELFKNGIKLGISSRGLGSVEMVQEANGDQVSKVGDDFELIAFDFVSNPSTHGAFMRPVNEGVEKQKPESKIESIINSIMRG